MNDGDLWLQIAGYGNAYAREEWVLVKRVVPGKPRQTEEYDAADTSDERLNKMLNKCGIVNVPEELINEMKRAMR